MISQVIAKENQINTLRYRPEIDGLRAIAVIAVILFHTGINVFHGGFVGVDIFFVISGYLITSIILSDMHAGTFSFIAFYERRIRRIIPALFFVMLTSIVFAWIWFLPDEMDYFSQSLVAVISFVSNVLFYLKVGYFDISSNLKPLLHTWSLAVEEQYYIFFPIFVVLTWKIKTWKSFAALLLIGLLSFIIGDYIAIKNAMLAFYLLPTRCWEIIVGALVAYYCAYGTSEERKISRYRGEIFSTLGLSCILYAILKFNETSSATQLLIPVFGTAFVVLFATEKTVVGKLLRAKCCVFIGLISYSAYLWHQPIFAFSRYREMREPSTLFYAVLITLTFVSAILTWKYIEKPFRDASRINMKYLCWSVLLIGAFLLCFGLGGFFSKGYPYSFRIPNSILNMKEMVFPSYTNGWCFNSGIVSDDKSLCSLGDKSAHHNLLLFGDSFAGQYEPFWDKIGKKNHFALNVITTGWCYPSRRGGFPEPTQSKLHADCLSARQYLEQHVNEYDIVVLGGNWSAAYDMGDLPDVIDVIDYVAHRSKLVVLMASPMTFDNNIGLLYKRSQFYHLPFNMLHVSDTDDIVPKALNHKLSLLAKKYSNVIFIDRNSMFTSRGKSSFVTKNNIPFSLDGKHISVYGSKQAVEAFMSTTKYQELLLLINQMKTKNNDTA